MLFSPLIGITFDKKVTLKQISNRHPLVIDLKNIVIILLDVESIPSNYKYPDRIHY